MDLILSPKDWTGDVPVLTEKNVKTIRSHYEKFLATINFNKSVLVVFYQGYRQCDYRDEHSSILVSHNHASIKDFIEKRLTYNGYGTCKIGIFEFATYKEAFEYCIDLKEGL